MPNWRYTLEQARYPRAHPIYREAPLRCLRQPIAVVAAHAEG